MSEDLITLYMEPIVIEDPEQPGKRAVMYKQLMDDGEIVTVIVPEALVGVDVTKPN